MSRKAFQLAISTLILLILGVVILIAILIAVTGGFERFESTTSPFLGTTAGGAIKQACKIACNTNNKLSFCCSEQEINEEIIKCTDTRLELSCNLDCTDFQCSSPSEQ